MHRMFNITSNNSTLSINSFAFNTDTDTDINTDQKNGKEKTINSDENIDYKFLEYSKMDIF